jgi:hypothetical protein
LTSLCPIAATSRFASNIASEDLVDDRDEGAQDL